MGKDTIIPGLSHNALAVETVLIGHITAKEDIRIDGKVTGNVSCEGKLILGQLANIKGNISCINAEIEGNVEGDITATELLVLKMTAKVTGNISTKRLVIEPNAQLNGHCKMA